MKKPIIATGLLFSLLLFADLAYENKRYNDIINSKDIQHYIENNIYKNKYPFRNYKDVFLPSDVFLTEQEEAALLWRLNKLQDEKVINILFENNKFKSNKDLVSFLNKLSEYDFLKNRKNFKLLAYLIGGLESFDYANKNKLLSLFSEINNDHYLLVDLCNLYPYWFFVKKYTNEYKDAFNDEIKKVINLSVNQCKNVISK